VTTRGVTLAALLAALGRPSWWLLALAGFLVRGGVLLFALVIVSLPSPLILSNIVAPLVVPLAFGRLDAGTLALIGGAVGIVAVWLVGGGLVAAATEVALVRDAREAMIDEGLVTRPAGPSGRWLISRVAAVRLLAHLPTAFALGIGSVRIASVAYVELTAPADISTPLIVRIAVGAVGPIGAIIVTWLVCETVGGLAARRIVLDDASLWRGLRGAVGDLLHRPVATLLAALVTTLVLAIDLAALLGAVAFVWTQVRERLLDSLTDPLTLTIALLAFGATWVGALALTGLIDAWRSAAMTFERERAAVAGAVRSGPDPDQGGTFGASAAHRPGDWFPRDQGGSL
jgi:hypothetical protein